ncbi:MAG: ABC transporter permease subunit [candidate division WOR-3 bacterium]
MKLRKLEELFFKILIRASVLLVIFPLLSIISIVLLKGGKVLISDPKILITTPGPKYLLGGKGGFVHAILGSLYLVIPATLIASVIGLGIAVFLQPDYSTPKISELIRMILDILWGIPSIVYGVFVLTILIFIQGKGCLFAGIPALTLLELPIITRYIDEALIAVPVELKNATYSIGANKFETLLMVSKYALSGIVAGILIGMGRGIGDAASIIFTSGTSNTIPKGLFDSVTALPIIIFQQASSCYPSVREHAYAAAFILVVIVGILNLTSRFLTKHFSKYIPKGK